MRKLVDFKCDKTTCGYFDKEKEFLVEGNEVPICICDEPMVRVISAHAGYSMKGSNGSSQTPRHAGSYRRKKE